MLIRQVTQHPESKKWAFVEYSDEGKFPQLAAVLGDKEFDTEEEAKEWAKGFDSFSYSYKDPEESKREKLVSEKEKLEKKLSEINTQLSK